MSMNQEISAECDYLYVKASGWFSLVEAKRTFVELLEAVARHKTKKVLFDGRRVTGEPETIERFYYGQFAARAVKKYAEFGVSPATRFAYVLEEPMRDPERFGETVAVNRGMFVKTFDILEDAFGWLQIPPAHQPLADPDK